jgi:hypothetical protein
VPLRPVTRSLWDRVTAADGIAPFLGFVSYFARRGETFRAPQNVHFWAGAVLLVFASFNGIGVARPVADCMTRNLSCTACVCPLTIEAGEQCFKKKNRDASRLTKISLSHQIVKRETASWRAAGPERET